MVLCSGLVLLGCIAAFLRYFTFKVKVSSPAGEGLGLCFRGWDCLFIAVEPWGRCSRSVVGAKCCCVELKWKTKPKTDWWLWIDLAAALG